MNPFSSSLHFSSHAELQNIIEPGFSALIELDFESGLIIIDYFHLYGLNIQKQKTVFQVKGTDIPQWTRVS